ncbi:MAG: hypothetical protein Ct9H90mP13_10810 [Pseudomonadota bacterium]|nr:MAG: hypothetical protein Ct9H90mP13_10810 [Pseudomonadota bacterium]
MQRESNLTWFNELPENNSITEGSWWAGEDADGSFISVDRKRQNQWGYQLGDQLEFNVAGENFTVKGLKILEKLNGKASRQTSFLCSHLLSQASFLSHISQA